MQNRPHIAFTLGRIAVVGACATLISLLGCSSTSSEPRGGQPHGGGAGKGAGETGDTFRIDAPTGQGGERNMGGFSGGSATDTAVCGDGKVDAPAGEECDDGDSDPTNGCDNSCKLVDGWVCSPGEPCQIATACGNGQLAGSEECDDGNTRSTDGCDEKCLVTEGWKCPTAGQPCEAKECGDGIIAGTEQCDDGNAATGDGCSATCKIEDGYFCPDGVGMPCKKTVCGNNVVEGKEACDDGNLIAWDGCDPDCRREPECSAGSGCTSVCGDGIILQGDDEECDDGNTVSGDGCSEDCTVEEGWSCTVEAKDPPRNLHLPITYFDTIASPTTGNTRHADFQQTSYTGDRLCLGMVEDALTSGVPVSTGRGSSEAGADVSDCGWGSSAVYTSKNSFATWFTSNATTKRVDTTLCLKRIQTSPPRYVYTAGAKDTYSGGMSETNCSSSTDGFYPIDGSGWISEGSEIATGSSSGPHNAGFATTLRTVFEYRGGETLQFDGDDDVWVFVNGKLALDLGGLHPLETGCVTFATPSGNPSTGGVFAKNSACGGNPGTATGITLDEGDAYEVVVFHAERLTGHSNFTVTLTGFFRGSSQCASECGDGIVTSDEVCDDGDKNGTYGHCSADCQRRGPHCGDGVVQSDSGEACDDGFNTRAYVFKPGGAIPCGPGCKPASYCGDGVVDSIVGEDCDTAPVDGKECPDTCEFTETCGNGQLDPGEGCDDGNRIENDGCSPFCKKEFMIR